MSTPRVTKMMSEMGVYTLFDEPAVRAKVEIMSKWEAMIDDARNPDTDFDERVQNFLQFGKRYRWTITFEELEDAPG